MSDLLALTLISDFDCGWNFDYDFDFLSDTDSDRPCLALQLDQPTLGMGNREYYLKSRPDRVMSAYENMAINFSKALGAEPADAEHQMKAVIEFEIELANVRILSLLKRIEICYNDKFVTTPGALTIGGPRSGSI